MAETKRNLATVLANLADNTTQEISAEDIRDAIVTVAPDYGTISVVSPLLTVMTDTVTFFDVNGTYTFTFGSDWDMAVNGRLRHTGPTERSVVLLGTASFICASNNQVISFVVAKNGTPILSSEVQRRTGTSTDVGAVAFFAFETAGENDYFTVQAKNNTSATDLTSVRAKLGAIGFA